MGMKIIDAKENILELEINNGDLEALRSVVERLNFKNEISVLRFALAVLTQSATNVLTITNVNGKELKLSPADEIKAI